MQEILEIAATVFTWGLRYFGASAIIGLLAAIFSLANDRTDLVGAVIIFGMATLNWPIILATTVSEKIGFWAREHLDLRNGR